ncbi:prepilin peptidase [Candidatus Dependentiae bacterium]|nr:prepilin peptidase [Candidatus Dependentiae bacterium]
MIILMLFIGGLCWGSFLNMLATRILHRRSLLVHRSYCPSCKQTIAWYDNIPLLSYLLLKAQCRSCKAPISWLYPATELITALLAVGLYSATTNPYTYTAYTLFFSGLLAATRTDLEAMLIPQTFSLGLIPLGLTAAWFGVIQVSLLEAALGALCGYGLLWAIAKIFLLATKREGMGAGDYDLLAGIGAWIGPLGIWLTLMIASCAGTVLGLVYLYCTQKTRATRIPFGPFLAAGAIMYIFFRTLLLSLFIIP